MLLVHPPDGTAQEPRYKPKTHRAVDGLTPPLRSAYYRFGRTNTGLKIDFIFIILFF